MITGRRPYLDADTAKRIIDAVTTGATLKDAATMAGISVKTVLGWVAKGRKQGNVRNKEYAAFVDSMELARAKRRAFFRNKIIQKGDERGDWRAYAFIASVTEPEAFGQRVHVVVEQELTSAIDRLKSEFSHASEIKILERALAAIAGEIGPRRIAENSRDQGEIIDAVGHAVDPPSADADTT